MELLGWAAASVAAVAGSGVWLRRSCQAVIVAFWAGMLTERIKQRQRAR